MKLNKMRQTRYKELEKYSTEKLVNELLNRCNNSGDDFKLLINKHCSFYFVYPSNENVYEYAIKIEDRGTICKVSEVNP